MRDLSSVPKFEQEQFFNSFDTVLCDVDGVLWLFQQHIVGASAAIKLLQNLGKQILFVSNNCTKSHEVYYQQLKSAGYNIERQQLIVPVLAMISLLKKLKLSKDIFLIGMMPLRTDLEQAGFNVITPSNTVYNSFSEYIETCIDDERVGAVIADLDVNMNVHTLQEALTYLQRPEVEFIAGGADCKLYNGPGDIIIGPGCFHRILEDMSDRKPRRMGKPSPELNTFIQQNYKIPDSSRILFIGDSIPEDMGFASTSGYRKLLVLSGLTKGDALTNWNYPESYKPDYYVDSLNTIHHILSNLFPENSHQNKLNIF